MITHGTLLMSWDKYKVLIFPTVNRLIYFWKIYSWSFVAPLSKHKHNLATLVSWLSMHWRFQWKAWPLGNAFLISDKQNITQVMHLKQNASEVVTACTTLIEILMKRSRQFVEVPDISNTQFRDQSKQHILLKQQLLSALLTPLLGCVIPKMFTERLQLIGNMTEEQYKSQENEIIAR